MSSLETRLNNVLADIRALEQRYGRDAESVSLLAVSKQQPEAAIREVAAAGQRAFGENYVQEATRKMTELAALGCEWHFIGALQSNKSRSVAEHCSWLHTLDRTSLARRLNDQRPDELPPLNVCLQVNVSGEASKSGVAPETVRSLALEVADFPRLRLRGLMAIPAVAADLDEQRRPFARLRELLSELNSAGLDCDTLSMA